jgi:hypothetical protein
MIEMYGHKFTSTYGDVPNETWAQALGNFTGAEIATGLKACFQREDNWPPSLPEFLQMCRPVAPKSAPFHRSYTALPPPRPSKEKAQSWLAKMREKL